MVVPAPPPGFYWDDTWYLLMAEWLQARRETWELSWSMLQHRQYPPLFPLALSLAGAGLEDTGHAHAMNAVFLALAAGAALLWFRIERFGWSAALLAAALVPFNPVALYWLPTLFSEHLYLLLTTLALALAALRREWAPLWLVIGIVVGLAIATRTTGWALAGAVTLHLLVSRQWLMLGFFAAGGAAGWLTIPWLMVGLPDAPGYLDQFTELPYEFGVAFLLDQAEAIGRGWVTLWGGVPGALIVLLAAVPGWWIRFRQNRPDAWYVPGYLAMLLAWPYPEHMSRFLWPLVPALLVCVHALLQRFGALGGRAGWSALAFAAVVAATLPTGFARTLDRLLDPPPADLAGLSRMPEWTRSADREYAVGILGTRQAMLRDMARIESMTDPGYCIYSEVPALVTAQAGRVALASPWERLEEVDRFGLDCLYYYLLPDGLPGTTAGLVAAFGERHDELFRSESPHAPGEALGIFYNLKPQR